MARVVVEKPWTNQPQIPVGLDLSNPIARKIRYCSTLGRNTLDLRSGKLGVVNGGAPVKPTTRGLARDFTAASSQSITLPTGNMVSGYPLTVACWASTRATAGGQVLYSLNGTGYSAILGYLNSSTTLALMPNVGSDPTLHTGKVMPSLGLAFLVAVHRSGTWDLYVNGVLAQTTDLNSAWAEPAAGNHSIGSRLGGATLRYYDGTISDLCVFEGELSVSEIKSLSNNPWQIYAPAQRVIWDGIIPAAATVLDWLMSQGQPVREKDEVIPY